MYKSKQGSNIIQTQSVDRCINNQSTFETDVEKCDFEKRVNLCNDTTAFTPKLSLKLLTTTASSTQKSRAPLPPLATSTANNEFETVKASEKRRPTTRQYYFTTTANYYLLNPLSIIDIAAGAISMVGFFVVIGVLGFILFA